MNDLGHILIYSKKAKGAILRHFVPEGAEVTLPHLGRVGIFIPNPGHHLKFIAVAPVDLPPPVLQI